MSTTTATATTANIDVINANNGSVQQYQLATSTVGDNEPPKTVSQILNSFKIALTNSIFLLSITTTTTITTTATRTTTSSNNNEEEEIEEEQQHEEVEETIVQLSPNDSLLTVIQHEQAKVENEHAKFTYKLFAYQLTAPLTQSSKIRAYVQQLNQFIQKYSNGGDETTSSAQNLRQQLVQQLEERQQQGYVNPFELSTLMEQLCDIAPTQMVNKVQKIHDRMKHVQLHALNTFHNFVSKKIDELEENLLQKLKLIDGCSKVLQDEVTTAMNSNDSMTGNNLISRLMLVRYQSSKMDEEMHSLLDCVPYLRQNFQSPVQQSNDDDSEGAKLFGQHVVRALENLSGLKALLERMQRDIQDFRIGARVDVSTAENDLRQMAQKISVIQKCTSEQLPQLLLQYQEKKLEEEQLENERNNVEMSMMDSWIEVERPSLVHDVVHESIKSFDELLTQCSSCVELDAIFASQHIPKALKSINDVYEGDVIDCVQRVNSEIEAVGWNDILQLTKAVIIGESLLNCHSLIVERILSLNNSHDRQLLMEEEIAQELHRVYHSDGGESLMAMIEDQLSKDGVSSPLYVTIDVNLKVLQDILADDSLISLTEESVHVSNLTNESSQLILSANSNHFDYVDTDDSEDEDDDPISRRLRLDLEQVQREKMALEERIQQLENEAEKTQSETNQIMESALEEKSRLQSEIDAIQKQLQQAVADKEEALQKQSEQHELELKEHGAMNEKLSEAVTTLNQELKLVSGKLEDVQNKLISSTSFVAQTTEEKANLTKAVSQLNEELAAAKLRVEQLEQELDTAQMEAKRSQSNLEQCQLSLSSAYEKISAHEQTASSLKMYNERLTAELQDAQTQLELSYAKIAQLEKSVQAAESRISVANDSSAAHQQYKIEMETKVDELQHQLTTAQGTIASQNEEIAKLQDVQTQLELSYAKIAQLEKSLEAAESRISVANDSSASHQKYKMEMEAKVDELQYQSNIAQGTIASQNEEIAKLQALVKTMESGLSTQQQTIVALNNEKTSLSQKLETVQSQVEHYVKNLEECQLQLATVQSSNDSSVGDYENRLKEKDSAISVLQEENTHLQATVSTITDEIRLVLSKQDALIREKEEAHSRAIQDIVQNHNDDIQSLRSSMQDEINSLGHKLHLVSNDLQLRTQICVSLEQEVSRLETSLANVPDVDQLQQVISSLSEQLRLETNRLSDARNENVELVKANTELTRKHSAAVKANQEIELIVGNSAQLIARKQAEIDELKQQIQQMQNQAESTIASPVQSLVDHERNQLLNEVFLAKESNTVLKFALLDIARVAGEASLVSKLQQSITDQLPADLSPADFQPLVQRIQASGANDAPDSDTLTIKIDNFETGDKMLFFKNRHGVWEAISKHEHWYLSREATEKIQRHPNYNPSAPFIQATFAFQETSNRSNPLLKFLPSNTEYTIVHIYESNL